MPYIKGASEESVAQNVDFALREGKSHDQAMAIARSYANRVLKARRHVWTQERERIFQVGVRMGVAKYHGKRARRDAPPKHVRKARVFVRLSYPLGDGTQKQQEAIARKADMRIYEAAGGRLTTKSGGAYGRLGHRSHSFEYATPDSAQRVLHAIEKLKIKGLKIGIVSIVWDESGRAQSTSLTSLATAKPAKKPAKPAKPAKAAKKPAKKKPAKAAKKRPAKAAKKPAKAAKKKPAKAAKRPAKAAKKPVKTSTKTSTKRTSAKKVVPTFEVWGWKGNKSHKLSTHTRETNAIEAAKKIKGYDKVRVQVRMGRETKSFTVQGPRGGVGRVGGTMPKSRGPAKKTTKKTAKKAAKKSAKTTRRQSVPPF